MVRSDTLVFEAEVRDAQQHYSTDDPSNDAQYTVTENTLHPATLTNYDRLTVYVDDTHDNTFDISIETTAAEDTDWSAAISEATASGGTNSKFELTGPVGRLRVLMATPGTAPTSGRTRVTVHAIGRE